VDLETEGEGALEVNSVGKVWDQEKKVFWMERQLSLVWDCMLKKESEKD